MKFSGAKNILPLSMVSAIVLFMCVFGGCRRPVDYHTMEGSVWNTQFRITYASSADECAALDDSVLSVVGVVDHSLSVFTPQSLISRINRGETDATDKMFRDVFSVSLAVNRASGGMFDPTVAPLVDLWGFGRKGHETPQPTDQQIDSALNLVGIVRCSIDSSGHLQKPAPGMQFNFSAIAKGYGCDCVAEMLARNGVSDCMVEIGGEIAVRGKNPRGDKWQIMIDRPVEAKDTIVHRPMVRIAVTDCGIATSGNYRNYRQIGGRNLGHTISPVTGRPVSSATVSVTVVAADCCTADAYATAIMAMPFAEAAAMLGTKPEIKAMIIRDKGHSYSVDYFNGFDDLLK